MNRTEYYIAKLYDYINVDEPSLLSIELISVKLSIDLQYWPYSSELVEYKGRYKVFINERLNLSQQWQDFGHEIKHYCFDRGSQNNLQKSYKLYQEVKADYFAYHFCVPSFMLAKLKGVTVYDIMNLFNVEFDFAMRRMEMYMSQIIDRRNYDAL